MLAAGNEREDAFRQLSITPTRRRSAKHSDTRRYEEEFGEFGGDFGGGQPINKTVHYFFTIFLYCGCTIE